AVLRRPLTRARTGARVVAGPVLLPPEEVGVAAVLAEGRDDRAGGSAATEEVLRVAPVLHGAGIEGLVLETGESTRRVAVFDHAGHAVTVRSPFAPSGH